MGSGHFVNTARGMGAILCSELYTGKFIDSVVPFMRVKPEEIIHKEKFVLERLFF